MNDNNEHWFAIQTRQRHEKTTATHLSLKGYEQLLPLYQSRRRRPGRFREIELPLFPGYVFCRFDPQHRLPILMTPGVMQIVGSGKVPVPVDDAEIASIQAVAGSSAHVEPWPYLKAGQRVTIEVGPLRGVEGILLRSKGLDRLIISVSILRRSVAVEIDRRWVSPALTSPCAGPFTVYSPGI